jgi:hypothetical protein
MVRRRTVWALAVLFVVTGAAIAMLSGCLNFQEPHALDYRSVVPPRDVEQRVQKLGNAAEDKRIETSALEGLPAAYVRAVTEYVEAACEALKTEPIKRKKFYHRPRGPRSKVTPYPDDANPVYDRDVIVPIALLPRPEAVKSWSVSAKGRSLGWRTAESVSEHRGSVYGRTLIYEPGTRSKNPQSLPSIPFEAEFYSWDLYVKGPGDDTFFLKLGKLVLEPHYDSPHPAPVDQSAVLRLGEKSGAKLLGEFVTIPACLKNARLRWTTITDDSGTRQFLAYALLDGNGVKRDSHFQKTGDGVLSPYVRPLLCEGHQPKVKQHDELLLPTPLGWPPTYAEWKGDEDAHEEWCLDDWFPAQPDACWVIREAEDSKPLQESFLLMPAAEPSDRPVFFIALFAETEPMRLVKELAALYQVSPDAALNSPETMERLNALYEKVRDFPLSQ